MAESALRALQDHETDAILGRDGAISLVFEREVIKRERQAAKALHASEMRYRLLVEQSPYGIFVADAQGRYIDVNTLGAKMLGYSRDEILTMSLPDILFPEEIARLPETIASYANGAVVTSEWRFRRKDGSELIGELVGRQFPDGHLQGVLRDITERKQEELEKGQINRTLRESEQRFRVALANSRVVLFEQDLDLRYTWIHNPKLGYAVEQVIGKTDAELMDAAYVQILTNIKRHVIDTGQPSRGEVVTTAPGGSPVEFFDLSVEPRYDEVGHIIGVICAATDITARKRSEDALRDSEKRHRNYIENAPEGIFVADATGHYLDVNLAACELVGYSRSELLSMSIHDLVPTPEELPEHLQPLEETQLNGGTRHELSLLHKNGSRIEVELKTVLLPGNQVMGFCSDITDLRQMTRALLSSEARYRRLADDSADWIWEMDPDGRYRYCNKRVEELLGIAVDAFLATDPQQFVHPDDWDQFAKTLETAITNRSGWHGVRIRWKTTQGEFRTLESNASPMFDPQMQLLGFQGVDRDITEQMAYQRQLEHVAHFDTLTGLPNRVLFADRLHQAMLQAARSEKQILVVFIDLDGFKAINDTYSHEVGDRMLVGVADHMKQVLRAGDTIARLGGDEFVAVLIDVVDPKEGELLIQRILKAAAEPVKVGELELCVSASIGFTCFPQGEAVDADQLLRQADHAMYYAKIAGKNRSHLFDAAGDRSLRDRHESLEQIRLALQQGEFVLHYQPKVNLRNGKVVGAEALIRWQHPTLGLRPPADFLPLIETHPLGTQIGEWVLDSALATLHDWTGQGLDLTMCVNISAQHLQQAEFVERLRVLLATYPEVVPQRLELEILETSALENLAAVAKVIRACQALGVRFALDDFGTGYASMNYLKHLPVQVLKIDRSFVHDMLDDPEDLAILEGVLGLAMAFRREVIAEGLEVLAPGRFLLMLGCDLAQGFGIARPMPAADLPAWIANWQPDLGWDNLAPLRREDLPLLHAGVELRAWVSGIEDCMRGTREGQAELKAFECRLGAWLETAGSPQTIEPLLRQLCDLGLTCLGRTLEDGLQPSAETLLEQLRALLVAIWQQFEALLHARQP